VRLHLPPKSPLPLTQIVALLRLIAAAGAAYRCDGPGASRFDSTGSPPTRTTGAPIVSPVVIPIITGVTGQDIETGACPRH
jgi:hypothetical protein